jgi:hypothetical protein
MGTALGDENLDFRRSRADPIEGRDGRYGGAKRQQQE